MSYNLLPSTISAVDLSWLVSGLICAPIMPSLTQSLDLPLMVPASESTDPNRTAYTISIDSSDPSVTTGISSHDRALTLRTLASPSVSSSDFRRPGHVFPLRAREGGVRERKGHTEAAVEFCRLAGKKKVGVICELVNDGTEEVEKDEQRMEGETVKEMDGRLRKRKAEMVGSGMLRTDGCVAFARRWGLRVCTIEALVEYLEGKEGEGIEDRKR